ncbi:MAG: hypothetical protein HQ562_01920 [Candidatus Marinimicrobia bacterium]|nr:hypothetical protein [Candidatus Neomarinimicrobiota bacterium]
MSERWSIWIDIEGFKFLHDARNTQALLLLGRLIEDIFLIGSKVFPDDPDRLFIHQVGDGLIIVSDFMEDSLERAVAIAIVLVQSLLSYGGLARAGISSGDFADITGCYPPTIRENQNDGYLRVGRGVMSITKVMGGALVNAFSIAHDGPSGPMIRYDLKLWDRICGLENLKTMDKTDMSIGINWYSSDVPLVDDIAKNIRENKFEKVLLKRNLEWYLNEFDSQLSENWKSTARKILL